MNLHYLCFLVKFNNFHPINYRNKTQKHKTFWIPKLLLLSTQFNPFLPPKLEIPFTAL